VFFAKGWCGGKDEEGQAGHDDKSTNHCARVIDQVNLCGRCGPGSYLMYRTTTFLLLLLFVNRVTSVCKSNQDCEACHICSADGICHQVPPFTDPNNDCGSALICGVRSVCGPLAHCVLEHKPSCKCHYGTGECLSDVQEIPIGVSEEKEERALVTEKDLEISSRMPGTGEELSHSSEIAIFIMCICSISLFCLMIFAIVSLHSKKSSRDTVTYLTPPKHAERPFVRWDFFQTRRGHS